MTGIRTEWILFYSSFLLYLIGQVRSEVCYVGFLSWDECTYGCCTDDYVYTRCCTMFDAYLGIIIGCVIGGIVLIGIIIFVIVFFCYCKKRQAHRGNVIQPSNAHNTTVIHTQGMAPGTQPGYGYGPPPPSYGTSTYPPPPAGYSQTGQPAYPMQPVYPPGQSDPSAPPSYPPGGNPNQQKM